MIGIPPVAPVGPVSPGGPCGPRGFEINGLPTKAIPGQH